LSDFCEVANGGSGAKKRTATSGKLKTKKGSRKERASAVVTFSLACCVQKLHLIGRNSRSFTDLQAVNCCK